MPKKFDLVFFSLGEIAERYDFSTVYALKLVTQGRLKAHRMLRGHFVSRADLVAFEREYVLSMRGRIKELEHKIDWLADHPVPTIDRALRQRVAAAYPSRTKRSASRARKEKSK